MGESSGTRRFAVLAAVIAALALAAGCGGGGSSSDEISVKTGGLSKAEFIAKADAICTTIRSQFTTDYVKFMRANNKSLTEADLPEIVGSIVTPHFEEEIQKISDLGVPKSFEAEVTAYLHAMQQRLEEAHENPKGFTSSTVAFSKAIAAAEKAGLNGCAESLG